MRLVEILVSQAATSLENASIYEALKESELRYRQIVETANEGVWVLGPDALTTSVNARMAEMLGYRPEEMVGKSPSVFMEREDGSDHGERMENRRRGISEHYVRRFVRKDGGHVWTIASACPIFDAKNSFCGAFAMFTDITEQKNAENSLKKSAALLSAVQRISRVGGWEYDIQSDKAFWSEELYRIHEMAIDPDIDHVTESQKCYRPEDRKTLLAAFRRVCECGEPYDLEFPFTTFKGNHLWVRTTAQPVYEGGRLVRVVGNLMDVTERRQAEEEIRKLNQELEARVAERTKQLEEAADELEAFAYSVSHDLRAPLRHIDSYVELLASRSKEALDDSGRHYLESIADSARRMGILIDDLLQFSRTGRVEVHRDMVDMNQLLGAVLVELREGCTERNIEWIVSDLPSTRGDAALIRQVWINLVENAIKYTRPKERARIEIRAREEGDEIIYSVRDNGVGFDMQYAGKLFGVFERLHSTEEFEGSGIGLATVSRIIARHGGRVGADARLGEGARFFFALPFSREGAGKQHT